MRKIILTQKQLNEIIGWESDSWNDDFAHGGSNEVFTSELGDSDDDDYFETDIIDADEFARMCISDYMRFDGIPQQYTPCNVSESYSDAFLNQKFKASPTSAEHMSIQRDNNFVQNYIKGQSSLKAMRQKVYNMEHGKSAEDPETQKRIIQAYNNAKFVNGGVTKAKNDTKTAFDTRKQSKQTKDGKVITYF